MDLICVLALWFYGPMELDFFLNLFSDKKKTNYGITI